MIIAQKVVYGISVELNQISAGGFEVKYNMVVNGSHHEVVIPIAYSTLYDMNKEAAFKYYNDDSNALKEFNTIKKCAEMPFDNIGEYRVVA